MDKIAITIAEEKAFSEISKLYRELERQKDIENIKLLSFKIDTLQYRLEMLQNDITENYL